MDEGGGDDYTGAEVASKEVDVEGNAKPSHTDREHWEKGGGRGDDKDDEKGRDTSTEMAIVSVGAGVEVAEDIVEGCRVQIHVLGIEVTGAGNGHVVPSPGCGKLMLECCKHMQTVERRLLYTAGGSKDDASR